MNCFKGGDFSFNCQCFLCNLSYTVYLYLLKNCFDAIYEIKHNKHKLSTYVLNLPVYLIIYRLECAEGEDALFMYDANSDHRLGLCVNINLFVRKFEQQCYHDSDTWNIFYNSWNIHHCRKC